jgi:hypothetical protein
VFKAPHSPPKIVQPTEGYNLFKSPQSSSPSVTTSTAGIAASTKSGGLVKAKSNGSNVKATSSWVVVGARCIVPGRGSGTVRWVGVIGTQDRVGVELDEPNGLNDGSVPSGIALFRCKPMHGVFVTPVVLQEEAPGTAKNNHGRSPDGNRSVDIVKESDGGRGAVSASPFATTTAAVAPVGGAVAHRAEKGTKIITLEKREGESWGFSVAKDDSGAPVISKVPPPPPPPLFPPKHHHHYDHQHHHCHPLTHISVPTIRHAHTHARTHTQPCANRWRPTGLPAVTRTLSPGAVSQPLMDSKRSTST